MRQHVSWNSEIMICACRTQINDPHYIPNNVACNLNSQTDTECLSSVATAANGMPRLDMSRTLLIINVRHATPTTDILKHGTGEQTSILDGTITLANIDLTSPMNFVPHNKTSIIWCVARHCTMANIMICGLLMSGSEELKT